MRQILGIALCISVLGNAVLLYRVVDLGAVTTDQASEVSLQQTQLETIKKLLPSLSRGVSREDLVGAARAAGLETHDKGEEGVLIGTVEFALSKDGIATINFN